MARKPRVHYPEALYHVILRGNGGQTIFFDDKDRTRFYFLLREGMERFGNRIHAFCFMKLGKVTNRDTTTLSSAAKRLVIRAKKDLELAERMKALLETVS